MLLHLHVVLPVLEDLVDQLIQLSHEVQLLLGYPETQEFPTHQYYLLHLVVQTIQCLQSAQVLL